MPPVNQGAVRLEGMGDLVRAMRVANSQMVKDVRQAIEVAGESVKDDASNLALTRISGMRRGTIPWHSMRTGVYKNTVGFVAPVQRGDKSLRARRKRGAKFTELMMSRALEPALAQNESKVMHEFTEALNDVAKAWARV